MIEEHRNWTPNDEHRNWTPAAGEFWKEWCQPAWGGSPSEATRERIFKRAGEIATERGANRIGRNHFLAAIAGD